MKRLVTSTLLWFMGRLALSVIAASLLLPVAIAGGQTPLLDPGNKRGLFVVENALSQFVALKHHGEALGWMNPEYLGAPDPSIFDHYQGLARYPGEGVPVFYVTHKDNDDDILPGSWDKGGYLHVVRFGTRPTTGERLRSNLQALGTDTEETQPDPADTWIPTWLRGGVYSSIRFDGSILIDGAFLPAYVHPGGMAIVDDILFVPLDTPRSGSSAPGQIVLFDLQFNPEFPVPIEAIELDHKIDNLAVTEQDDGSFLVWVNGDEGKVAKFYKTTSSDLREDGLTLIPLPDPGLLFGYWPTGTGAHQSSTFLREPDGSLYLIGMRRPGGSPWTGSDYADLYWVDEPEPGRFTLTQFWTLQLWCNYDETGRICNCAAANNAYVSPSGELILYSMPHDDEDGYDFDFVRLAEFRHRDVNREGSPLRLPTADAGGPYSVQKGGAVTLSGSWSPPVDRPWVELYDEEEFQDRSIVVDYDDQSLLELIHFALLDAFNEKTTSIRWRAPNGVDIELYENPYFNFLGLLGRKIILRGTGSTQSISNLDSQVVVPGVVESPGLDAGESLNFDDKTSSLRFVGVPPSTSATFEWDLDGDGLFGETGAAAARGDEVGATPIFSAADLDGQTQVTVTLRATALGVSVTDTAVINEIPELYFVPDVVGQFNALAERAEALGFGIGGSPDATVSKHYQGIARSDGPGVPYFFITRNGNIKSATISDDPGNLLIVEMGSRPTHGERLRSNRLMRNRDTDDTPPDYRDTTVSFITFDGNSTDSEGNIWPNYGHPGGVQLIGDVLVVPLEEPYDAGDPEYKVLFLDVSTPESPHILGELTHDDDRFKAAVVGITKRSNGRYLLLVTGGDNEDLFIFESKFTNFRDANFKDDEDDWTLLDEWTEAEDEDDLGYGHDWPTNPFGSTPCNAPYQSLNFVREGSLNGDLYLIGIHNKGGGAGGAGLDEDRMDLFRVEWEGSEFKLRFVSRKNVIAKSTSDGDDIANLAAASGVYVSPTGELIIYGTEHDNDGPDDPNGMGTIKAGEWRHRQMARPGSPTFLPTPVAEGPFEVPEGGSVTLKGRGEPPITRAWIELFADPNWTDRSIVIDYEDWYEDDFWDFKRIDQVPGSTINGFSDTASSWRWFAPVFCTLRVNDDDFNDPNFPGRHTKTLSGNGLVNTAPDLKDVRNDDDDADMDDELTSMQFFKDCDYYYNAGIDLSWDLDGDGTFETPGESTDFSAEGLDGPEVVTVGLMATHPFDGTFGTEEISITVTNVSPEIESFVLNFQEAWAWREVEATGTFRDAGILDTHTATIDWGDGTTEAAMVTEEEGSGTVTGSHRYFASGTYMVTVKVTDDDGGIGSDSFTLTVLPPAPSDGWCFVSTVERPFGASELFFALILIGMSLAGLAWLMRRR